MSLGWIRSALLRLREERLAGLGLALLVLITAFVFATAPRALDAAGDRVLRDEVAAAGLDARNIVFVEEARIPASGGPDGPLESVDERGAELAARLPTAVREVAPDGGWQVETGRHQIDDRAEPYFLRLRLQEGIDDHIRYVAGRPPAETEREVSDVVVDGVEVDDLPVLEIALARPTTEWFGVDLGETLILFGDQSDLLIDRGPELQYRAVELVGIYEAIDPDDPWWMGDPHLQRPFVRARGSIFDLVDAAALLSPTQYPSLLSATSDHHPPFRYTWRRFVDPARLDAATAPALLSDLRRARTTFPSANPSFSAETGYRTGLDVLIEQVQAQWASAVAILTVVAVGPGTVALAALSLVAILAARRRRVALAVSRSRGASIGQLVVAVVTEALLFTVPAVVLAAIAAAMLIPGGATAPTIGAVAAVALLTTAILVATSVPSASATADSGRGGRDTGIVRRPTPQRLVLEGLVVALASGGAWLLRERGVRGSGTAGVLETADPLIAAVPALVGLAAGIVAVRLYPWPMRFLAWLAARRRDLVPVLAMRRTTSGAGVGPILVVLLATATIGAFSSAALVHLERGAEIESWQSIGAAYRIEPGFGALPGTLEADRLPGAEAAAELYQTTAALGLGGLRLELLVVEPETLQAVAGGTPADPRLPLELFGPGGAPIPAIVSASLGERAAGVRAGEVFELSIEGYTLQYRAAVVRDSFPGIPDNRHFVVVSRTHINTVAPPARLDPTFALVRAPEAGADELRAAALRIVEGGSVESRAERTAALRDAPVAVAVRLGIIAAAAVAAVYAALAVAAALALAGLSRSVEVAHLRTLGLTRRQAFALIVVEHGPTVVASFALGLALGLALFLLLRPGLGLSALVGSPIDVPLTLEAGQLALVLAAIVAVVMLGLGVGTVLQRAAAPMSAIRRGFE